VQEVPIDAVKSLSEIHLEKDCLLFLRFYTVDTFLGCPDSIKNLSAFKETELLLGESPGQNRTNSISYDLGDNFITKIAERYGTKVSETSRKVRFQNQY